MSNIINYVKKEQWYGSCTSTGMLQPFGQEAYSLNLLGENLGNQSAPLLISTMGQWIWSHDPFEFSFIPGKSGGEIHIKPKGRSPIESGRWGETLASAYHHVSSTFFPPTGQTPPEIFFTKPQYNTWIELMYDQEEQTILTYAQSLLDQGYPPGILMIDDNWQENYGNWEFSARRFKNPQSMMDKLHTMGFKVMLWICPFVSADSPIGRELAKEGLLIMEGKGSNKDVLWANTENKPALIRWWNGASYVIDLSHPKGWSWFKNQMDSLVKNYGVDGFKLDAGDASFYNKDLLSFRKDILPNDHMELFARMGLEYPYNELRASWKLGGEPLVQRLRDKRHNWEDLEKLIPDMTVQSLMGYGFTCPDMIGGGEYQSFLNQKGVDEELFIRSAQASALMPMMQFSAAPWRVLGNEAAELCKEAALLHEKFGREIYRLAQECARSGEPIFRSMEYNYPHEGFDEVRDQFMLGSDLMVAPLLKKGTYNRFVQFPVGKWKAQDGKEYEGPASIKIDAPLNVLPYFRLINDKTA